MTTAAASLATPAPRGLLTRALALADDDVMRRRLYWMMALALFAVAWILVLARAHLRHTTADFALSDATGYYVYLPSLVIDGDLQFQNQLNAQYGDAIPDGFSAALARNRWPAGIALTLSPAFAVAHVLALGLHALTGAAWCAPTGYSPIYFVFCVGWAMALGTVGMICADRLLRERFGLSPRVTAAAVLTTWLGTHFLWYFVREPLVAHMIGAAWVTLAVYLVHRMDRAPGLTWRLPALVFVVAMALACRLTNVFILPVMLFGIWRAMRPHARPARTALLVLACVAAVAPLLIQYAIMQQIAQQPAPDSLQAIGYGSRERFYWTQPALFRILFSSHHGLLFATPALLLSAWGIVRAFGLWRGDRLMLGLLAGFAFLWYVNASWYAWWFGHSVGNRAFVELAILFTIGFGFAFHHIAPMRPFTRNAILACLALCFCFNWALMALKLSDVIEGNEMLIPAERRLFQGRWERV